MVSPRWRARTPQAAAPATASANQPMCLRDMEGTYKGREGRERREGSTVFHVLSLPVPKSARTFGFHAIAILRLRSPALVGIRVAGRGRCRARGAPPAADRQ